MNVSNWFFRFGVLAILVGIGLGIWMGKEEDFTLRAVHAHLNLAGFVLPFLFAFFYRAYPAVAGGLMAKVNLGLTVLGVLVMMPALAMMLLGDKAAIPYLIAGELLFAAGVVFFGINVFRATGAPRAPAAAE